MISHHAMWRDELQTWSMVRESHSLGELFFNMRFDGTPPLWYLGLWLLSFVSISPLSMQLFHFACASLTGFLVMARAPFPLWCRLLLVSGYYFAFEFMVISRGYILGLLFAIVYCIASPKFRQRPWLAGIIIGLIANTTSYGAVLSIALFAMHAVDCAGEVTRKETGAGSRFLRLAVAYLPFLAVAIYFMVPAKGGNFVEAWNLTPTMRDLTGTVAKMLICLVPIPMPGMHFWNTLLFFDHGLALAIPVATFTVLLVIACLWGCKRELFLFFICLVGMTIFGTVIYQGYNRHGGTLMICFVIAIWLAGQNGSEGSRWSLCQQRWRQAALYTILGANVIAFAMAAYEHSHHPFSGSREMAAYVTDHHLEHRPIIGDVDFEVSAVAGYLNIPLYYVANGKRETFIRWNTDRTKEVSDAETQAFIAGIEARHVEKPLLLLSYPAKVSGYHFLFKSAPSIVQFEELYLYEKD